MVTDLRISARLFTDNTFPPVTRVNCLSQHLPLGGFDTDVDASTFYTTTPCGTIWASFSNKLQFSFSCIARLTTCIESRDFSFDFRRLWNSFIPWDLDSSKTFIPRRHSLPNNSHIFDMFRRHFSCIVMGKKASRTAFFVRRSDNSSASAFAFNLCHQ